MSGGKDLTDKPKKIDPPPPLPLQYAKTYKKQLFYYKHIEDKLPLEGPEYDYTRVDYEAKEEEVKWCEEKHFNVDEYEEVVDTYEKIIGDRDMGAFDNFVYEKLKINRPKFSSREKEPMLRTIYEVWRKRHAQKRMRLFWEKPNYNDNDTNKVFRPREESGMRTRPKRKNEMDSYNKLKEMKDQVKTVVDILHDMLIRESKKRAICQLNAIEFD